MLPDMLCCIMFANCYRLFRHGIYWYYKISASARFIKIIFLNYKILNVGILLELIRISINKTLFCRNVDLNEKEAIYNIYNNIKMMNNKGGG